MTKLALAALLVLSAAGCRRAHLGSDTGAAYRAAFAAQVDSKPARTARYGAADAAATNAARHKADKPAAGAGAGALIGPMSAPIGGGAGSAWPGATGNITLEAK